MPSLHELWRTIEREEVLAGVEAQWQLWLGDTVDVVRPFLKPEQNLASSYPCERHPSACARRVVHHGPDDIVAVCGLDESECDRLALKRADVVVYGLALPRLLAEVAHVLGGGGDVERISDARVWSLGSRSGTQFFFVLPDRDAGYEAPLATLLCRYPTGEFAVLVPTQDSLAPANRALLSQRRASALSCDDLLDLDGDGHFVRRQSATYVIPTTGVMTLHDGAGAYGPKPLAMCWRHDNATPVPIADAAELDRARAVENDVEHFVDATLDKPRCSRRNGKKKRDDADLTQGEVAMLLAFIARRAAGRDHERPENLRISILSTTESKKQAFKEMRRKVDRNTTSRQKYALFKARRNLDGGPQLYEIRPDEGVTFCFIVRPDDLAAMREAAVR